VSRVSTLPTGPVTFLCVDVEGSTRLAHALGGRWGEVLGRVRTATREAIGAEGGSVVDARGDEVFAAFEEAGAALRAAQEIQRAVTEEPWPDGTTLRVRVGLHSGQPMLG
jgi:class 3 adenylate cyclase